jgi:hypothetical protein
LSNLEIPNLSFREVNYGKKDITDMRGTIEFLKGEGELLVAKAGNPYTTLRIAPITVADLVELPEIIPYQSEQRVEFIFVEDAAHAFGAGYKGQKIEELEI